MFNMIQSKQDYKEYLAQDRVSSNVPEFKSMSQKLKNAIAPSMEWQSIKALRYMEYCENVKKNTFGGKILWFIAKWHFRRISIKLGYSIPINVFGPGLSLPHRGNIIINPQTRIGANCRIHVGVNIGAHKDKAPQIGDNVYIGPGVIIFGDIKIANNVTIVAASSIGLTAI